MTDPDYKTISKIRKGLYSLQWDEYKITFSTDLTVNKSRSYRNMANLASSAPHLFHPLLYYTFFRIAMYFIDPIIKSTSPLLESEFGHMTCPSWELTNEMQTDTRKELALCSCFWKPTSTWRSLGEDAGCWRYMAQVPCCSPSSPGVYLGHQWSSSPSPASPDQENHSAESQTLKK